MKWFVSTVAVWVTAYVLPGVTVDTLTAAIIAALLLGIANTFIRPLLIILTLPITVLSLGIFVLFINAVLVLLTSRIVPGFYVASFGWAFLFGIVQAIIGGFLNQMGPRDRMH